MAPFNKRDCISSAMTLIPSCLKAKWMVLYKRNFVSLDCVEDPLILCKLIPLVQVESHPSSPVLVLTEMVENTSFPGVRLARWAFSFSLVVVVSLVRVVLSAERSPVPAGSAPKKRASTLVLSLRVLVVLCRT